jgi:hypothetical protein
MRLIDNGADDCSSISRLIPRQGNHMEEGKMILRIIGWVSWLC